MQKFFRSLAVLGALCIGGFVTGCSSSQDPNWNKEIVVKNTTSKTSTLQVGNSMYEVPPGEFLIKAPFTREVSNQPGKEDGWCSPLIFLVKDQSSQCIKCEEANRGQKLRVAIVSRTAE